MQVADINNKNWQINATKPNQISIGLDDIEQSIQTILQTRKGEDCFRPDFGCDLWSWMDKPSNVAVPNIKKEILDSLGKFEPRISVVNILHYFKSGQPSFEIGYISKIDNTLGSYTLDAQSNNIETATLVLSATYQEAFRYNISLVLNSSKVKPSPPEGGFSSLSDLFTWIQTNWYSYGQFLLVDNLKTIVFYARKEYTSGTMLIDSQKNVLSAIIPRKSPTNSYSLILSKLEVRELPYDDTSLFSPLSILRYAQSNYGSLGSWTLQSGVLTLVGKSSLRDYTLSIVEHGNKSAFSNSFNLDFES